MAGRNAGADVGFVNILGTRSGSGHDLLAGTEGIVLYCRGAGLRKRLQRLLDGAPVRPVRSRKDFSAQLGREGGLGVVGLETCSGADAMWLRDEAAWSSGSRPCVVVAPLSLFNLRCLQELADRFHLLWEEEADARLVSVIKELVVASERDPLGWLGRRIVGRPGLRPSLRAAVEEICQLSSDGSAPPRRSVSEVARLVCLSPATLSRYWRADVPLRCGPKRLLSWSALLWAVRLRSELKWDAVAKRAGVTRRTIERHCSRFAGCTLAQAARNPDRVRSRFREWVAEVWEVD